MLPFHKRARASSSIEISSDDLEAIELPQVRPPSVRPAAFVPKVSPRYDFSEDELTVVRPDKRVSTSPPPRFEMEAEVPRIPPSYVPRFERHYDDEPTQMHVNSSRPLLSMSSSPMPSFRKIIVANESQQIRQLPLPPPPPSALRVEEPPRSAVAVDAASSAHVRAVDLSMTSSVSGSTDLRNLRRPTFGWATALVAVGVFAGIITAFVARGEGLATAAAFVDPSQHSVTADVAKAVGAQPQQQQAPVAMGAGAATPQVQVPASKPAAPSCNADAVAPKVEQKAEKVEAKAETKETAPVAKAEKVEKPEVKETKVAAKPAYVAPVRHVEPVREREVAANPPPVVTKPIAKPARRGGDDMESASAADALAKAQLDAALSR